jgi:hypothetical protein
VRSQIKEIVMSLNTESSHDAIETPPNHGRVTKAVLIALGLAVVGMLVGVFIGATIGGNWFPDFAMGSAHGYEATANIGLVAGGLTFGAVGLWLGLRRSGSRHTRHSS